MIVFGVGHEDLQTTVENTWGCCSELTKNLKRKIYHIVEFLIRLFLSNTHLLLFTQIQVCLAAQFRLAGEAFFFFIARAVQRC